ncbi:hypothetical protein ACQP1U_16480 [Actinomycetota bacterium]
MSNQPPQDPTQNPDFDDIYNQVQRDGRVSDGFSGGGQYPSQEEVSRQQHGFPQQDAYPQDAGSQGGIEPLDPTRPRDDSVQDANSPANQQADPFDRMGIPHKTWRTRSGSQVTVAGCCLPLPIGCLTVIGAAVAAGIAASRGRV